MVTLSGHTERQGPILNTFRGQRDRVYGTFHVVSSSLQEASYFPVWQKGISVIMTLTVLCSDTAKHSKCDFPNIENPFQNVDFTSYPLLFTQFMKVNVPK